MLIIIRGLPGSGKSTAAREKFGDRLILETDQFLTSGGRYQYTQEDHESAVAMIADILVRCLRFGMDVVIVGCFSTRDSVLRHIATAERFRQPWRVYAVEGPRRYNNHMVPEEVYASMAERWEDFEGEYKVSTKETVPYGQERRKSRP